MRLSVVFELILVFLFLAFAAARVIEKKNVISSTQNSKKLRQGSPNRYCSCTTNMCNCCRDFSLPVVPIKGPGCASIMYLKGDNMMITMSFGERILSNTTIVGPKPKPVCMSLPGGISQFCGRVYGISRTEKNFKACLGLELRALDDVEAALRVSCFKFGPKGVSLESAPPVPEDETKEPEDEDEDEDEDEYDLDDEEEDDDIIGFGGDLTDDEDEEDDDEVANNVSDSEDNDGETDSADYAGFSVLGEDIFGGFFNDDDSRPIKNRKKPIKKVMNPVIQSPSTAKLPTFSVKYSTSSTEKNSRRPTNKVTLSPSSSTTKITTENPTITIKSMVELPSESNEHLQNFSTSMTTDKTLESQTKDYFSTKHILKLSSTKFTSGTTVLPLHRTQAVNITSGKHNPTESFHSHETVSLPANEVKLPDFDVEKIEAVVAIAQQGITSNVLKTNSLSVRDANKLSENHKTVADKLTIENDTAETTASFLDIDHIPTEFKVEEKWKNDYESKEKTIKNGSMHEDSSKSQLNMIIEIEDDKIEDKGSNKMKSHEEVNEGKSDDINKETVNRDNKRIHGEKYYDKKLGEKEDENVGQEVAEKEDDIFEEFIANNEAESIKNDVLILKDNNNEFRIRERIEQGDTISVLDDNESKQKLAKKKNENQNTMKIEQPLVKKVIEDIRNSEINKETLLAGENTSVYVNNSSDEVKMQNQCGTNSTDKDDDYVEICGNKSSVEDKSNSKNDKSEEFVKKCSFSSSKPEHFLNGSSNKEHIGSEETKSSGAHISQRNYQHLLKKLSNFSSRTHRRMNLDRS